MKKGLFLVLLFLSAYSSPTVDAQQPDILQEQWYHSYATLTLDVNAWADDYPEIVNLLVVGQTELGRNLWMLQISDWSQENKSDGTAKEVEGRICSTSSLSFLGGGGYPGLVSNSAHC